MGGVNLILTSSGNFGCIPDDDTLEVTFIPPPIADFTFTDACAGQNTNFTDMSTTTDGTINTWTWDFGDMTSSIASNPIHPYPAPGTYSANLIATSTNGCADTVFYDVVVNPVPVAILSSEVACVGQETVFTDLSFISSGTIVDWEWDFENGLHIDNNQNPVYTFDLQGSYPVTLTVTSDLGCVGTTDTNITVLAGPTAAFSIDPNPALALKRLILRMNLLEVFNNGTGTLGMA